MPKIAIPHIVVSSRALLNNSTTRQECAFVATTLKRVCCARQDYLMAAGFRDIQRQVAGRGDLGTIPLAPPTMVASRNLLTHTKSRRARAVVAMILKTICVQRQDFDKATSIRTVERACRAA